MKTRLGSSDILFPVPAALIVSGSQGIINVATVAWIGIVSSAPPIIAVSLYRNRYSLSLIRLSKEFSVNISSSKYFREVDFCGLVSGREVNKLKRIGFTTIKSAKIGVPIIKECPFNLECKVIEEKTFGEWTVLFGEILETYVDHDKFNASNKIDIAKIDPLVYCATIREYWKLGDKLGDSFSVGLSYKRVA